MLRILGQKILLKLWITWKLEKYLWEKWKNDFECWRAKYREKNEKRKWL